MSAADNLNRTQFPDAAGGPGREIVSIEQLNAMNEATRKAQIAKLKETYRTGHG